MVHYGPLSQSDHGLGAGRDAVSLEASFIGPLYYLVDSSACHSVIRADRVHVPLSVQYMHTLAGPPCAWSGQALQEVTVWPTGSTCRARVIE